MVKSYRQLEQASKRMGEDRDCAVIAIAAVSNLPYEYVWELFDKHGRKPRDGTPYLITALVMAELNLQIEEVPRGPKTVRTFARHFTKGRYLIRTRDHILAVVNGEVIDWTKGRVHRILDCYRVTF